MAGVVGQIEAEEKAQWDRLFATTEELEKARLRIRSMEEEIAKDKVDAAKLVIAEPIRPKPVAPVNEQGKNISVASTTPDTTKAREQELATLRDELAAQEALRARE